MKENKSKDYSESTKYLLKRLIRNYIKKHFLKLSFALTCMVIVSSTTAIQAWMMQPVLDDIFLNRNADMLIIIPLAIILIAVL